MASCFRQDIATDSYEVIAVDDGSNDGSRQLLQHWCEAKPNVRLVTKANGGLSSARNAGWANSSGEYVMFLDADDYLSANVLGYLLTIVREERPEAVVYGSADDDREDADVASHELRRRAPFLVEGNLAGKEFMSRYNNDGATYALWNRALWDRHGFRFKEGIYHEDSELIPRIYYAASRVFVTNRVVYNVYVNPASITRKVNYDRAFDYLTEVAESHHQQVEQCPNEDRHLFHYRVALYVNQALYVCLSAPGEVRRRLDDAIYAHRHLLDHLRRSGVMKYQVEYWLFKIFPHHYTAIYRLMKKCRL